MLVVLVTNPSSGPFDAREVDLAVGITGGSSAFGSDIGGEVTTDTTADGLAEVVSTGLPFLFFFLLCQLL